MRKVGLHVVAVMVGALFAATGVPVAAQEGAAAPEVGRYVDYSLSATDRNWSSTVVGQVQFYSVYREWKIFGDVAAHSSSEFLGQVYVRVKQNINNTTQDGRWYGLCERRDSGADIQCDRGLDKYSQSGSSPNYNFYYWLGNNDTGEYFGFPTSPGRGLRGVWIRVCHPLDGPDVCGPKVYAPNPYVPQ